MAYTVYMHDTKRRQRTCRGNAGIDFRKVENSLHPCEIMQNDAYKFKMSVAKRVLNFNDVKLFIFI